MLVTEQCHKSQVAKCKGLMSQGKNMWENSNPEPVWEAATISKFLRGWYRVSYRGAPDLPTLHLGLYLDFKYVFIISMYTRYSKEIASNDDIARNGRA